MYSVTIQITRYCAFKVSVFRRVRKIAKSGYYLRHESNVREGANAYVAKIVC